MLTRRQFARGLALTAVGLLVPAPVAALAVEATPRLWALDGSMLGVQPPSLALGPWWELRDGKLHLGGSEFDRLMDSARALDVEAMEQAAAFAEAATKTLDLISNGIRDLCAFTASGHALDPTAIMHLTFAPVGPMPTLRRYPTRLTAVPARSRPAYRRRLAA